jgi:hypothetical protein
VTLNIGSRRPVRVIERLIELGVASIATLRARCARRIGACDLQRDSMLCRR